MKKEWDFKIVDANRVLEELNAYSEQGWEILTVYMTEPPDEYPSYHAIVACRTQQDKDSTK